MSASDAKPEVTVCQLNQRLWRKPGCRWGHSQGQTRTLFSPVFHHIYLQPLSWMICRRSCCPSPWICIWPKRPKEDICQEAEDGIAVGSGGAPHQHSDLTYQQLCMSCHSARCPPASQPTAQISLMVNTSLGPGRERNPGKHNSSLTKLMQSKATTMCLS